MLTPRAALILGVIATGGSTAQAVAGPSFVAVSGGHAKADIVADTRGCQGANDQVLTDAAAWLAESLQRATGTGPAVLDRPGDRPAIVLARADQYPQVAARTGLTSKKLDAFCIASTPQRVHILGRTEIAVRHGVATLLHRLGFRWYNPSPRWWIAPPTKDLTIDLTFADAPALIGREIWYGYGVGTDTVLGTRLQRWGAANRLGSAAPFRVGHSYGSIALRNKEQFEKHPEYFNLLKDGQRYEPEEVTARIAGKFCYSNRDLIELVVADRIRLLEERRQQNPYEFMVSMDPSDGRGTCHCPACAKLGTPTDRVIYLANQVAKALRQKHPDAWVGLYAYSSHRLPPTIAVEPNVYIQVAMGFNRTGMTLPELVDTWAEKVRSIGLREYYGVEAWDWGLPGRVRCASVDYHRKWIPFYVQRHLNAMNAQTNANWGAQTLGLVVATRMLWDPRVDVDAIVDEYFRTCFGPAAEVMQGLQKKFDAKPELTAAALQPLFKDVEKAYALAGKDPGVRNRVVDMMAYLHYVALFAELAGDRPMKLLTSARTAEPGRDDAFYTDLRRLMQYAWQTRRRGMVHYYALARRLCNGIAIRDKRPDFWMFNKGKGTGTDPVWMVGDPLTDEQIVALFQADLRRLSMTLGQP